MIKEEVKEVRTNEEKNNDQVKRKRKRKNPARK